MVDYFGIIYLQLKLDVGERIELIYAVHLNNHLYVMVVNGCNNGNFILGNYFKAQCFRQTKHQKANVFNDNIKHKEVLNLTTSMKREIFQPMASPNQTLVS